MSQLQPAPLQCLLDLDGVLVDFVGAVEKRFGIKITYWDFDSSGALPISKSEFWESCNEEFWANLDWTPDGREILQVVEEIFKPENVCVLTSPCQTRGCMEGKMRWINEHIPAYRRRYLMGPAKEFCSGPRRILVDDSDRNATAYRKAGGFVVLVPRPWNVFGGKSVIGNGEHVKAVLKLIIGD